MHLELGMVLLTVGDEVLCLFMNIGEVLKKFTTGHLP